LFRVGFFGGILEKKRRRRGRHCHATAQYQNQPAYRKITFGLSRGTYPRGRINGEVVIIYWTKKLVVEKGESGRSLLNLPPLL
jgi:hypothetical protein